MHPEASTAANASSRSGSFGCHVPGDKNRIDRVDKDAKSSQMRSVDSFDASDGDADGVNGYRVMSREIDQHLCRMRVREEVFGMGFEPPNSRDGGRHLRQMRKPETDACRVRRPAIRGHGDGHCCSFD